MRCSRRSASRRSGARRAGRGMGCAPTPTIRGAATCRSWRSAMPVAADRRHWAFKAADAGGGRGASGGPGSPPAAADDGAPGLRPRYHRLLLRGLPARSRRQPRRGGLPPVDRPDEAALRAGRSRRPPSPPGTALGFSTRTRTAATRGESEATRGKALGEGLDEVDVAGGQRLARTRRARCSRRSARGRLAVKSAPSTSSSIVTRRGWRTPFSAGK